MTLKTIFMSAFIVMLVGCGKEDAATTTVKSSDEKMARDIAKIREIKEKEQADKAAAAAKSKEFGRGIKDGANAPLIDYK
jgi:hypothetical protein